LAAQRKVEWFIKFPTELGLASSLDGSGNVTVSRVGADFEVDIPIATRGELDLGFSYDYTRYDFNDATGFVAGSTSPFQDIHREAFRVYYGQQQTLQLGWSVGGSIGLSGEEGADTADSVVGSVFAGVGYYLSRDLRVGVAVGIFSQLEQSPLILRGQARVDALLLSKRVMDVQCGGLVRPQELSAQRERPDPRRRWPR
jgi:hypothetical protein